MSLNRNLHKLFPDGHTPKGVVFRVDAANEPGLSYGHFYRCKYLAQLVKEQYDCAITFVFDDTRSDSNAFLNDLGFEAVPFSLFDANDMDGFYDTVIIDLPEGPDPDFQGAMERRSMWIVVIDDAGRDLDRVNVVLNDSVLAMPDTYPAEARLLLGPDYLLYNPELDRVDRGRSRSNNRGYPGVYIFFGGSDPTGLTPRVLETIRRVALNRMKISFTFILGPGYADSGPVLDLALKHPQWVTVLTNPESLVTSFSFANLLICAGGRTLYEALHLDIPCVAIGSTEHEGRVIEAFRDQGKLLRGYAAWDEAAFTSELPRLLERIEIQFREDRQ